MWKIKAERILPWEADKPNTDLKSVRVRGLCVGQPRKSHLSPFISPGLNKCTVTTGGLPSGPPSVSASLPSLSAHWQVRSSRHSACYIRKKKKKKLLCFGFQSIPPRTLWGMDDMLYACSRPRCTRSFWIPAQQIRSKPLYIFQLSEFFSSMKQWSMLSMLQITDG